MKTQIFNIQKGSLAMAIALVVMAPSSFAASTTINFATGQNSSGVVQTAGNSLDANWKASGGNSPANLPNSYVVAPGNADWDFFGAWPANGPGSSWIAPNPNSSTGNGNFTVTYTLDLTDYNLATAIFSNLAWGIDDSGSVILNNHTVSTLVDGWGPLTAFNIPTLDLVQGVNTLQIVGTGSDSFLEASRLQGTLQISTSAAPSAAPLPAAIWMVFPALVGMIGVGRRKLS